jgi:hypothetical protein
MGEALRMREKGVQFKQLQPGQQFQVDLKNAVPKACECGGKYFQAVVMLFTVSALVSPTGQEMLAQQPVLVCMDCKTPAK